MMFSIAVQVLFMWVQSFWCHLVNSNHCSKTVFKYSDFLLLELKNTVGILESFLPELNIEESHVGQAQRLREIYMHNSDGASSFKTDLFQTRKS